MRQYIILPALVLALVIVLVVSPALASPAGNRAAQTTTLMPAGSYCLACHLAGDPRLETVTAWKGGIEREANSPCPAASHVHTELYYTERMLLMIDRAGGTAGAVPEKTALQLEGYTQSYSRQLDQPVNSLEAFTAEAQQTRFRLQKIYAAINHSIEAAKKRAVLTYAGAISLIVLGSLVWGLLNTRAYKSSGRTRPGLISLAGVSLLVVIVIFMLPIFRLPAAEVTETTVEQQEAQAVLDTADRAATASDRAQARAWMLARLAGEWNRQDSSQSRDLLEQSVLSIRQVRENQDALWGQSLAVQEASVPEAIELQKASLIAAELNAARARLWSLPLIAVEWNQMDPPAAASLLRERQQAVLSGTGIQRDLELRSMALAWVQIDAAEAAPAAKQINDPAIRSWTQREIAVTLNQSSLFRDAAESARLIEDPVQRARALREAAAASGDKGLFDEALAALEGVTGAPLAYAISDLAAASGNADLVEAIGPEYPEALAYALLRLDEHEAAWGASMRIPDPIERGRAQAAIAAAAQSPEYAGQIQPALYRDIALRDIIRNTGNSTLTDSITSPYYSVQALTALGQLEAAVEEGRKLGDSYPLVELSLALAEKDPRAALQLVELMKREPDKAIALRAAAAETGDRELFEQALGMALAARVRGDWLAPAQASLDLAEAMWIVNPEHARAALRQAVEAALKISVK